MHSQTGTNQHVAPRRDGICCPVPDSVTAAWFQSKPAELPARSELLALSGADAGETNGWDGEPGAGSGAWAEAWFG